MKGEYTIHFYSNVEHFSHISLIKKIGGTLSPDAAATAFSKTASKARSFWSWVASIKCASDCCDSPQKVRRENGAKKNGYKTALEQKPSQIRDHNTKNVTTERGISTRYREFVFTFCPVNHCWGIWSSCYWCQCSIKAKSGSYGANKANIGITECINSLFYTM